MDNNYYEIVLEKMKNEPNNFAYIIHNTICRIVRHELFGHYCGYVYLYKDHPFYGAHYEELDINVHGGLTYSKENNGWWIIGFDCNHLGDYAIPNIDYHIKSLGEYRDFEYVKNECDNMAKQCHCEYNERLEADLAKILLLNKDVL